MTAIDDRVAELEAEISDGMEPLTALKRQYGSEVEDHVRLDAEGTGRRLSEPFDSGIHFQPINQPTDNKS